MFPAVYMDTSLGSLNVQLREEGSVVACTRNDIFYSWEGITLGGTCWMPPVICQLPFTAVIC